MKPAARAPLSRAEFGKLVREHREAANLSQSALARAARLDPTSLNRLENARGGTPRLSTINRICRALGWSTSDPRSQALLSAAGHKSSNGEKTQATGEELRQIMLTSVAEFNRWRETHDDDVGRLDWSGTDFRSFILRTADLHAVTLVGANFENTDLVRANLREANLSRANLRLADLRGANLREAILTEADLGGADLRGAYLNAANLRRAILKNADLRGADLRESDLTEADMRKADFRRADLSNANLTRASLVDTNLIKADLLDAKLYEADLRRAQFRHQELRAEADVRAAKFKSGLTRSTAGTRDAAGEEYERPDESEPWNGE